MCLESAADSREILEFSLVKRVLFKSTEHDIFEVLSRFLEIIVAEKCVDNQLVTGLRPEKIDR